LEAYLDSRSTVYRLGAGFSVGYDGRTYGNLERVLYDTGSEVNLISSAFAEALKLKIEPCATSIATSAGGAIKTVGKVVGPLICILNEGTYVEARTFRPIATDFYVMEGVDHLYCVMLSTHAAHDFSSSACPVRNVLTYHPFLVSGDFKTQAKLPLVSTRDTDYEAQSHLLICCSSQAQTKQTSDLADQDGSCAFPDKYAEGNFDMIEVPAGAHMRGEGFGSSFYFDMKSPIFVDDDATAVAKALGIPLVKDKRMSASVLNFVPFHAPNTMAQGRVQQQRVFNRQRSHGAAQPGAWFQPVCGAIPLAARVLGIG
jgi:hypothetical protein